MIHSKITKENGVYTIDGYYDMGSCQCGDINFKIKVDLSTRKVEYNHNKKGWYTPDGCIPYAGSITSILLHEHGIDIEGYEIVKS